MTAFATKTDRFRGLHEGELSACPVVPHNHLRTKADDWYMLIGSTGQICRG
jgi:hypothetical protein